MANFNYRRWNNIIGWLVFAVAAFVYLSTMQRTVSWWDCGEFISTTYKLEVPHSPGNPTFQLIGRIFTLFAFGDVTKVALMVNTMSALCSAFTILFLFWTITLLGQKIVEKKGKITGSNSWMIYGAGIIGALVYTFSDTFWFSAVEGEVYAMSSFFTAIVFWAMLRWEREADQPYASRWIILNAFLIGLAIGVHLLNLLTIPALVYIYYYKKFDRRNWQGWFFTGIISVVLVALIMYVIIPWTVQLAGYFELFFVNTIGMPFNSGTIIYFVLLIGSLVFGIWYTQKKRKITGNTILLSITFLLIGYSSFFSIVIRANEILPINMREPKDALSLVSYLNRDQYGSVPLFYGPYYNSPMQVDYKKMEYARKEGAPAYFKDTTSGKYILAGYGNPTYIYEPEFCTIFPRMHSNLYENHINAYKEWGHVKGHAHSYKDPAGGELKKIIKPTFGENLRFFFSYQVNHMYWRYFMWNFSGRQNDIQGHGSPLEGNWITGINFLDNPRIGTQENLTPAMDQNIAHNKYYLLPFILGLIGLLYHITKRPRDAWVVFLLFFMTGLAIILYLNQSPYQPRERDYAYVGSFYVFSIWIGFSVMAIASFLQKYIKAKPAAVVTTLVLLGVPLLMAQQNWDDHNRSKNFAAHDYGANYLRSCPPNAILFSNGDNDTYPLWYAQEVEGIRTDVRVVNYQLSADAWYANQMSHKINQSDRLPLSLTPDLYRKGSFDHVSLKAAPNTTFVPLLDGINFLKNSKNHQTIAGERTATIPSKNFYVPVNKELLLQKGFINEAEAERVEERISIPIVPSKNMLYKHELLLIDLLATNNWERPICFTSQGIVENFIPIGDYLHLIGGVYQLLPYKIDPDFKDIGGVRIDSAYQFIMEEFKSGKLEQPDVNIDYESMHAARFPQRQFLILSQALLRKGDTARAVQVLDKYVAYFPENRFPAYGYYPTSPSLSYMCMIASGYLEAGEKEKGEALLRKDFEDRKAEVDYFESQKRSLKAELEQSNYLRLSEINYIGIIAQRNGLSELKTEVDEILKSYH